MKAIILAGGYGTRLQPITIRTPKALLPLGDQCTIIKLLDLLTATYIDEIIISLNQNQGKLKEYLDNSSFNSKIKYIFEESVNDTNKLGAVGALLFVISQYPPTDYIVLGADNYFKNLNLDEMLKLHNQTNADVTIAHFELDEISKVTNYGVSVIDENKRIIEFQEKPSVEKALSTFVSTFMYIIKKSFLQEDLPKYVQNEIEMGRKPDNIGKLWEHFCKTKKIMAYSFSGYWSDVGSPSGYINANKSSLESIQRVINKNIKISDSSRISGKVIIGKDCEIGDNVTIIGPSLIGDNVHIDKNCIIGPNTIILHDTSIGSENILSGSIIFEHIITDSEVKINRAVVDGFTRIMKNVNIEEYSLIGYGCEIHEQTKILYNSKLWPYLRIDKDSIISSKIFYDEESSNWSLLLKSSKCW